MIKKIALGLSLFVTSLGVTAKQGCGGAHSDSYKDIPINIHVTDIDSKALVGVSVRILKPKGLEKILEVSGKTDSEGKLDFELRYGFMREHGTNSETDKQQCTPIQAFQWWSDEYILILEKDKYHDLAINLHSLAMKNIFGLDEEVKGTVELVLFPEEL